MQKEVSACMWQHVVFLLAGITIFHQNSGKRDWPFIMRNTARLHVVTHQSQIGSFSTTCMAFDRTEVGHLTEREPKWLHLAKKGKWENKILDMLGRKSKAGNLTPLGAVCSQISMVPGASNSFLNELVFDKIESRQKSPIGFIRELKSTRSTYIPRLQEKPLLSSLSKTILGNKAGIAGRT